MDLQSEFIICKPEGWSNIPSSTSVTPLTLGSPQAIERSRSETVSQVRIAPLMI
jgi:hypothetical protein